VLGWGTPRILGMQGTLGPVKEWSWSLCEIEALIVWCHNVRLELMRFRMWYPFKYYRQGIMPRSVCTTLDTLPMSLSFPSESVKTDYLALRNALVRVTSLPLSPVRNILSPVLVVVNHFSHLTRRLYPTARAVRSLGYVWFFLIPPLSNPKKCATIPDPERAINPPSMSSSLI
jgi:hypothetical protein